jgi:hypothetical protein
MSIDRLEHIRQFSFDQGPNYTQSVLSLSETECAETDNMYADGKLCTIPGAQRLITTAMAGNVVGLYQYNKSDGTSYFLAADSTGRLAYQNLTTWVNITQNLPSAANTFYDFVTFNNTLVVLNGSTVKMWDGTTFDDLGGSPPKSRYGVMHGTDYVFLAGHTSNPSQIRYSDTILVQTWPVGNTMNIGLDDGQVITGLQRFGDVTVVFKERSIWLVTGATPNAFVIQPTLSDVGCISPDSICLTDLGVFFMSEAGPALFNGFKTLLLNQRMRRILDEIDWDNPLKISSSYYPYRKQVLMSYQRTGQSVPDRALIFDLYRLGEDRAPSTFWPLTHGWTSTTGAVDSTGRKRVYFGHANGYVTAFDAGTTFNGQTITPRFRSRAYAPDRTDVVSGLRRLDLWFGGTVARASVKLSVDGGTFVAHGQSPVTLSNTGNLDYVTLQGDGHGSLKHGRVFQFEVSTPGATPINLHGMDVGLETDTARVRPSQS